MSVLLARPGLVVLAVVPQYEVTLEPGLNLIPWTGPKETPLDYAFGTLLPDIRVIWRWDCQ